jgi:hypothetical protein
LRPGWSRMSGRDALHVRQAGVRRQLRCYKVHCELQSKYADNKLRISIHKVDVGSADDIEAMFLQIDTVVSGTNIHFMD